MRLILTAIVASLMLAGTVLADTINVPADYPTIQGAIDASSNGDIVQISAGEYFESQLDTEGKNITIRGNLNSHNSIAVTINSNYAGRIFTLNKGETVSIENLKLINGNGIGPGAGGGAILIENSTNATISNCIIKDNTATCCDGGGIRILDSDAIIIDCTVTNNSSNYGGGIECRGGNPTIMNCTISSNTTNGGGGIRCDNSSPEIVNCVIDNNVANDYGGGILCHGDAVISDCIITNNFSDSSNTLSGGGIKIFSGSQPLSNNLICSNSPGQISGNWTDLGGNSIATICPPIGACCLNSSPGCVVDIESRCVMYGGEWLGIGSSCADCSGPVEPEVLGACCINGACIPSTAEGCFDGGGSYAGEGIECEDAGCPETCPGDLTGDNQVTIIDLLFVIEQWGVTCP